jgi:hypothetical protein
MNRGVQRGFTTLHVRHGGSFGEIDILYGDTNSPTTSNGGFGVVSDGFDLFLSSSVFGYSHKVDKLTPRQAGQVLWDDLLSKVGIEYA